MANYNMEKQTSNYKSSKRYKIIILKTFCICFFQVTSVSWSRCPMRDRDSPNSCRWAAASMGSTSGTRAGDKDIPMAERLCGINPVPKPTALLEPESNRTQEHWTIGRARDCNSWKTLWRHLCFYCRMSWRFFVWPSWLRLYSACAGDIELSVSKSSVCGKKCRIRSLSNTVFF